MRRATHRADEVRHLIACQGLLLAVCEGVHGADALLLGGHGLKLVPQSCRPEQRRRFQLLVHGQLHVRRQRRKQVQPLLLHARVEVHLVQLALVGELAVDALRLLHVRRSRPLRHEGDVAVLHLPVHAVDLSSGLLVEMVGDLDLLGVGLLGICFRPVPG